MVDQQNEINIHGVERVEQVLCGHGWQQLASACSQMGLQLDAEQTFANAGLRLELVTPHPKGSMTQHVAIELSRSNSSLDASTVEHCLHNQQSNKMSSGDTSTTVDNPHKHRHPKYFTHMRHSMRSKHEIKT